MKVTWLLNGRPVETMPDVSLSKIGKRISVMSIESVAGHHAGNYSCRVKNVAGMAEHSAILTVNGLSDGILFFFFLSFFILTFSFISPFSKILQRKKLNLKNDNPT